METRELLKIINTAAALKDTTRHCFTEKGRHESVAEHSWMTTLIALLISDEFKDVDMNKVIKMCIIHDLGEVFTGDIPVFDKNDDYEILEEKLLFEWLDTFPDKEGKQFKDLFNEMNERKTMEAKVYKAIDSLEAIFQHNLSKIDTWEDHEYELNITHGYNNVDFSDYLLQLRNDIRQDTLDKIEKESNK